MNFQGDRQSYDKNLFPLRNPDKMFGAKLRDQVKLDMGQKF